ncbi:MAG: aspartate aminotransferase family protein, partial [Thermomicrobiales bacterium]|nr:aspartate aminotransferase family protein [Thermomicrobiales bacterium]
MALETDAGTEHGDLGQANAKPIHGLTDETEQLARHVLELILARQRQEPRSLGGSATLEELTSRVGETVTPHGLGAAEALQRWVNDLAPANIASDNARYFAFIPQAPTEAAICFDMLVGASAIYGGSWMEAAGAVYAENAALRWLADLAGFPAGAGGAFVPGGTMGNLSALHAARQTALARRGGERPPRWKIAASEEAHSSIAQAAQVLDVDIVAVPVDARHRMTGETLRAALDARDADDLCAVVASAGATNLGAIDDLTGIAAV